MSDPQEQSHLPPFALAWLQRKPGQLIGKGHSAGDFLEAYLWQVLEEAPGLLRVRAHLPEHVKNPRGQLFGGFTPTYADLMALFTARTEEQGRELQFRSWMATTNMRIDYFEPIAGPTFSIESHLVKRRGRSLFVETRFYDDREVELAAFAVTTMREIPLDWLLGTG